MDARMVEVDAPVLTHLLHTSPNCTSTDLRGDESTIAPVDLRNLDYVCCVDENLTCAICRCPFIDPVRLTCDHTFCRDCFKQALDIQRTGSKTCPSCRKTLRDTECDSFIPLPRFVLNMVDELLVKCPQSPAGCTKTLRRSDVQVHVDIYCEFTETSCPDSDCKFSISRNLRREECLHIVSSCDRCNAIMMKKDLQHHNTTTCPEQQILCSYCDTRIDIPNVEDHMRQCIGVETSCPASLIGCPFVGSIDEKKEHQKMCPLNLLQPAMSMINRRMDDQSAEVQVLRHRNTTLEALVADQVRHQGHPPAGGSSISATPNVLHASTHSAQEPPLDSMTHYLLSLHEVVREDLDRLGSSVSDLDARTTLMIVNENLRLKEEISHMNALIASLRVQMQWLTSAKLQKQQRIAPGSTSSSVPGGQTSESSNDTIAGLPRRLSDSSREHTKL